MSAYDPFAPIYDAMSSPMTEDIAWYVELAREADGPLVELAVGTGRVAIPVARAIGRKVVGIDLSPAMLAVARERADAAGVELELHEADMRELTLAEPAALITCPFRSLLHLPTWADKLRVFERVAANLRPGGRFAWNTFVYNPFFAASHHGQWEERDETRFLVEHVPHDNRIDLTLESGPSISLWWATRSEWDGLIRSSGLELEALYGGFAREPFGESSPEFVYVARRPA